MSCRVDVGDARTAIQHPGARYSIRTVMPELHGFTAVMSACRIAAVRPRTPILEGFHKKYV